MSRLAPRQKLSLTSSYRLGAASIPDSYESPDPYTLRTGDAGVSAWPCVKKRGRASWPVPRRKVVCFNGFRVCERLQCCCVSTVFTVAECGCYEVADQDAVVVSWSVEGHVRAGWSRRVVVDGPEDPFAYGVRFAVTAGNYPPQ